MFENIIIVVVFVIALLISIGIGRAVAIRPSNSTFNTYSFGSTEFLLWTNIRPASNGSQSLGTAGSHWKDIYTDKLVIGSTELTESQLQQLLALLQ